jgi:polysaccharide pyruvyl transferase WcaK-like protein
MKLHQNNNNSSQEERIQLMNRSSFRLLVIADVDGEKTRHLGDEAMLEANLQAFRRLIPDVVFTVVSRDPACTAARYGVEAVAAFGFPRDPSAGAERGAMLDRLLVDASRGRENAGADGTLGVTNATTDAVARADGLVVSGGGNLSSTWPDLLYERVALLHLARILKKTAVVLGQTIGPRLGDDEYRLLAEALSSARFVGVRELPSAALALQLGVPAQRIWYQSDDALFLETNPESATTFSSMPTDIATPRIAVTIDPQVSAAGGAVFGALVSQLREISETTGATLMLIPHAFGNESAAVPSDLTEAHLLAEELGLSPTVVAAGLDARQAMQVAREAALIISSRYHPIVFGLAAGVPSIGIYDDNYCRIKVQGALAHAGLQRWTLNYEDITRGELLTMALELWNTRDQVRRQIESCHEAWREESRQRWAAVLRALEPPITFTPEAHPVFANV